MSAEGPPGRKGSEGEGQEGRHFLVGAKNRRNQ